METLNNYSISGHKFIIWFFRLLLLLVITILILIFTLSINDTVSIKQGEIIATSPQSDYKAPFEAQLEKINVKVGQQIHSGDTLLVIQNIDIDAQQSKTKVEIEYLEKKIQSIEVLRNALRDRKKAIDDYRVLNGKKYELNNNKLSKELNSLNEQFELQKERLTSANEKYVADSILYAKDMLSRSDYNNTKDSYLLLKENISGLKNQTQRQADEIGMTGNNFRKEQKDFFVSQVEVVEKDQSLLQTKNDLEGRLIQAKEALRQIERNLSERNVIATQDGTVNYIFNSQLTTNFIAKGELLISIAPTNINYYAKVFIPEEDIKNLKTGLEAQLKLDAYYYLQHGILKGKVTYIAERKEKDHFFALIDLPRLNDFNIKSGYTIQGDIVLQRMRVFEYLIKKIFKSLDKS